MLLNKTKCSKKKQFVAHLPFYRKATYMFGERESAALFAQRAVDCKWRFDSL